MGKNKRKGRGSREETASEDDSVAASRSRSRQREGSADQGKKRMSEVSVCVNRFECVADKNDMDVEYDGCVTDTAALASKSKRKASNECEKECLKKKKNGDDVNVEKNVTGEKRVSANVSVFDDLKKIGDELRSFLLLNESHKLNKSACDFVLKSVSGYERMLGNLMCENARLKGRLEECEKERAYVRAGAVPVQQPRSFAQAAAAGVNVACPGASNTNGMTAKNAGVSGMNVRMPAKPSFAVIVKGRENETNDSVMKKLMNEVKGTVDVRVKNVRAAKSGGVVIEMASEKDRECLSKCKKLEKVGLTVNQPKRMGPRVIVYDVPNEVTEDNFLRCVYQKNLCGVIDVNEFKKNTRVVSRQAKKGAIRGNIILEVTTEVRNFLLAERRVYVEWGAHRVSVYERVNRCYGCMEYGHMLRECKSERLCFKCGKSGHRASACTAADSCRNCKVKGLPSGHSVLSPECPEYVWRLERLRSRVNV